MRILDRVGPLFWALCLGVVVLFAFFAAIGGFSPADVIWLSILVAVLAIAFTIRAIRVGHVLRGPRSDESQRVLNDLRERRGF